MESRRHLSERAGVGSGQGRPGQEHPRAGQLPGAPGRLAGSAPRSVAGVHGRVAAVRTSRRLRGPARRRRPAGVTQPGNAARGGATRRAAGHRDGLRRARDPRPRLGQGAAIRRCRAEAEGIRLLPRRHPAPRAAHAVGGGGEDRRPSGQPDRRRPGRAQPVHQRRPALSHRDAVDRREGAPGRCCLHPLPRQRRACRPRQGVQGILDRLRPIQGHPGGQPLQPGQGPHVQPGHAQVLELPRGGAVQLQRAGERVRAAHPGRARQPADAAPLPEAAPAHDGRGPAAL